MKDSIYSPTTAAANTWMSLQDTIPTTSPITYQAAEQSDINISTGVGDDNPENEKVTKDENQDLTDGGKPKMNNGDEVSAAYGGSNKPIIEFTNDKGNVKVKERKILRDDILDKLHSVFAAHLYERRDNVNGGFSLCLGVDSRTGENIWAHVELTVNMKDPNIDSFTGKPKRTSNEVVVPQLFT